MQHNRALQRRHILHFDEGVGHQARRALAEAANPQLRAARKHAVAQRHVQRVSKSVHRAQVHRHSDRPTEHHRVEARRRPPTANRHGLRQRHATHAALRTATTTAGPRNRHVERQARLAHSAGTAAASTVGERRSQRIEARQRSRTAVARHHAHGGQAGHAVFPAALQHAAAGTVALHRHDAARDRQPGDKLRASGNAARNRHGTAAQRHPRQQRHRRRRLAHRPHVVHVQPPAATDRPTVAAHQRRSNRPLDAHEAQHRVRHREALAKHKAAAAAHNRHVRHGEHRVAP
ncbi:hypothetical protein TCDM_13601 [Trypanosoma cruzi Dm28c]|uniref:Uncharacterized protein n=1 Tax=Trypanosoma cruzi Dm28c TaxID=1416333 RepID=V5AS96_TRYCR|nr:hypothetical protein TCDM_13601 [Trypanosoma cruzi Dm28c]